MPNTVIATDDPSELLAAAMALRRLAEQVERAGVAQALEAGWSWARMAEALDVSRQAAHKKHAPKGSA